MLQGGIVSGGRTWLWTEVPGMVVTSPGSGGMEAVEVGPLKDKVPFGKVFLSSMEQIFGKIVFRTNNIYLMNFLENNKIKPQQSHEESWT